MNDEAIVLLVDGDPATEIAGRETFAVNRIGNEPRVVPDARTAPAGAGLPGLAGHHLLRDLRHDPVPAEVVVMPLTGPEDLRHPFDLDDRARILRDTDRLGIVVYRRGRSCA